MKLAADAKPADLSQLADRFSAEEIAALVDQRQNLMHKSFESTLSLDESKQLAVLEWQLDQLELAKGGESEEGLSKFMTRLEAISQYVNGMADTLKERRESSRDGHGSPEQSKGCSPPSRRCGVTSSSSPEARSCRLRVRLSLKPPRDSKR